MSTNSSSKRVGFILASIHTGSSIEMWTRLAENALQENGAFFIFPGGRLHTMPTPDTPRNAIYSLANKENIDGLISWASSIGGAVSLDDLTSFHDAFSFLPTVTIGQKIKDLPLVAFNAYDGMKELVEHFINVHGARRIAFLRGPANHTSAEDRFRAFEDVAVKVGLGEYLNKLVSDNFAWSDGGKAIEQLCGERGLLPGRDFDTVIAASDMMAFSAVEWLESKGYKVPGDVKVGGFNDSVESRVTTIPFSTVHMPYEEMGLAAHRMIKGLLSEESPADCSLATYKVVRESCGCNNFKSWIATSELHVHAKTQQQLLEELIDAFRPCNENTVSALEKLVRNLFENNQNEFFAVLTEALTSYFERGREISKLFVAENILRNANCLPQEYLDRILRGVHVIIPQVQGRVAARRQFEAAHIGGILSALKGKLLSVHDRESLAKILAQYLPQVGIRNAAIILNESKELSKHICSFNDAGEIHLDETVFANQLLVPEAYKREYDYGVYVVQPLFIENQSLGYLICGYSNCGGLFYEDLRSAVSSTLQSIALFEETTAARQVAEQAEFAKTEFFANVGSDLCDPLKHLSAKLTQMETNIENGVLDSDILSEQLIFLKSQIDAQLEKTETLVDLTRTQVNDLPMNKTLFDIGQLLPRGEYKLPASIPLLYGDVMRLKKALQTIFDFSAGIQTVSLDFAGVHITVDSQRLDWHKPELLLAEKLILLQYGEIFTDADRTTILLPWPNLTGLPPLKQDVRSISVYTLSEQDIGKTVFKEQVQFFDEDRVAVGGEYGIESQTEKVVLYWEPDSSAINDWIKVNGMRHHEHLSRASVLCFSKKLIGHTFAEVIEQKVQEQKATSVLFIGAKHTRYGTWATPDNTVVINTMAELDGVLQEITPSLIVFETVTEEMIVTIRRNQKTVMVPILVLPDIITSAEDVELLCNHPRIILCNRGAAESEQFNERIQAILSGDEILPPHTGALVKKAILYLNLNASQQIVRWKLADTVHVSEDYLTRIFHKEIGLSLWEYLNRFRIYLATKLLLETNDTIYEVAEKSGFQDQAYFCRVFKKIYGVPPGKIRTKQ